MLNRYQLFKDYSVRDMAGFNRAAEKNGLKPMPQIVIIIDELADLMMAAPGEVEDSICRLRRWPGAAGMHLVIATKRPRSTSSPASSRPTSPPHRLCGLLAD